MKKVIYVVSCIAIAIAVILGVNKFNSRELVSNDLLMENVEALTRGEVDGSSKGCSTGITYVNNMIQCPYCRTSSGRNGTQYSCHSNGNDKTCQSGFSGSEISCNCSHRPLLNINDVETFSCSN